MKKKEREREIIYIYIYIYIKKYIYYFCLIRYLILHLLHDENVFCFYLKLMDQFRLSALLCIIILLLLNVFVIEMVLEMRF